MENNLSVKVTLELSTNVTVGDLLAFARMAEATGVDPSTELINEMDLHEELVGYSIYVDPSLIKTQK